MGRSIACACIRSVDDSVVVVNVEELDLFQGSHNRHFGVAEFVDPFSMSLGVAVGS